jgi:hypothetical protein
MLGATLMIMEALPRKTLRSGNEFTQGPELAGVAEAAEFIEYSISGHSGDSSSEVFVDFTDVDNSQTRQPVEKEGMERYFNYDSKRQRVSAMSGSLTEKDKMRVLETMIAHSQFCFSGDNTLPVIGVFNS